MDIQEKKAFKAWFKKEHLGIDNLADQGDEGAITRRDYAYVGWQAAKANAVPERKYILQTFNTYSGVCEDTFNHKNIGFFESIDAAMFHARHIGLVMNHYGYEFRVIEAQEPK